MKKISIIIPMYNAEKTIKRCLNSIVDQEYENYEVIIVNDGSQDNSEKIVKSMIQYNNRIKMYKINNSGVSFARNYGIKNASGEYITFIDSDDYYECHAIDKLMDILNKNENIDYLKFGYFKDYGKFKRRYKFVSPTDIIISKIDYGKYIYPNLIKYTDFSSVWNLIIKTNIAQKVLFDVEKKYGEDRKYSFDLILNSENIYIVSDCLYHYVLNNNSVTNSFDFNKCLKQLLDVIDTNYYINRSLDNILKKDMLESIDNDLTNMVIKCFCDEDFSKYSLNLNELKNKIFVSLDNEIIVYLDKKIKEFKKEKLFYKFKIKRIIQDIQILIKKVIV